jgi:multiple sugar transport system permease protein
VLLIFTLIAMITPSQVVVLPIFLELLALGLNNTYLGLILASGFFAFGVYFSYVFFTSAIPNRVMDSARVDGCNRFQLFVHICLPLAKLIIALVAFFSFLANWSNYFLAFVPLADEKLFNLPPGLATLLSAEKALSNQAANDIPIRMPEAIQASIVVVVPVLIVFLLSQRFGRTGMLAGAEKGLCIRYTTPAINRVIHVLFNKKVILVDARA